MSHQQSVALFKLFPLYPKLVEPRTCVYCSSEAGVNDNPTMELLPRQNQSAGPTSKRQKEAHGKFRSLEQYPQHEIGVEGVFIVEPQPFLIPENPTFTMRKQLLGEDLSDSDEDGTRDISLRTLTLPTTFEPNQIRLGFGLVLSNIPNDIVEAELSGPWLTTPPPLPQEWLRIDKTKPIDETKDMLAERFEIPAGQQAWRLKSRRVENCTSWHEIGAVSGDFLDVWHKQSRC